MRALAPSPSQRFESAQTFRQALDEYLCPPREGASHGTLDRSATFWPRTGARPVAGSWIGRNHWAVVAMVLVGLVLAGAFGMATLTGWWSGQNELPPLALYWYGFAQGERPGNGWTDFRLYDGMTMYSGDQYRIVFSPTHDCYVYLLGASGDDPSALLFPNERIRQDNRCRANRNYVIPDGHNWFTLDEQAGNETLYLVASYDRLTAREVDFVAKNRPPDNRDRDHRGNGEVRTRGGELISRGSTIGLSRRIAHAQLKSGAKLEREMALITGGVNVVEAIRFRHEAAP
jgi:hypothetical protein